MNYVWTTSLLCYMYIYSIFYCDIRMNQQRPFNLRRLGCSSALLGDRGVRCHLRSQRR